MAHNSQSLYDFLEKQQLQPAFGKHEERSQDFETMRRRKEELHALVRRVIKNELSEQDRLLVRLHWYQGRSVNEIAALIGLSRSSVYRRLEKINDTIFEKLKYALEYRFDCKLSEQPLSMFQQNHAPAREDGTGSIGARLQQSRNAQLFSLAELSRATGLEQARLQYLEEHGADMTMVELKALTRALGMSSDALIFGYAAARPFPCGKGLLYG